MNRAATVLLQLESILSVTRESLAQRCGVGPRTIAADVDQLNDSLAGSASIRYLDGRYRLLIVDAEGYRRQRDRILSLHESFNDPQWRAGYILGRLLRSTTAVRTEDLAVEMGLGRTTVVADIAQVRHLLKPYGVSVEGRPRVGLHLSGPEHGIRLAVLNHAYEAAYRDYPLGEELETTVENVLRDHHATTESADVLKRWLTVVLDRHVTDHPVDDLPSSYRDLIGTPAHDLARTLADRLEPLLAEHLPQDEVLFLALPAAGLRMIDRPAAGAEEAASDAAEERVQRIFDRIADEMDVRLDPTELVHEFSQHITFLLNRMRYSLHLTTGSQPESLRERYPAAYRMATIAGEVIEEETGLVMEAGELSLMTTYFQVFLEDHASHRSHGLAVTIVAGRGPATARLVRSHLASVLRGDARYTIVPDSDPGDLTASDLVVTTPGARVATDRPVLELTEVFDREAVLRSLHSLRIPTGGPLSPAAPVGSVLSSLLDESRFVRLPPDCDYEQGTRRLVRRLQKLGLVGEGFAEALAERQTRSTMQLADQLGFPHATDATLVSPVCALGVVPRSDQEAGIRLIFLMAVPEKLSYDDSILIRVYDEIIRLGTNHAALGRISRLTSYEQFFYFMENLSTDPHS
ncbi:BglG family transcription antiterminator [Raineyella fluvialis]|uniref:PRD domain-containing protein n=1 Tax=Raineyella fluvialis TaxID=2662261 RepID=A0A5Q2FA36_9ACTN|nr:PRD domain-containing protein [Raineyella fluvialis]QGF23241.1 PRD domain-containing protein [Raineyella fluvialis]